VAGLIPCCIRQFVQSIQWRRGSHAHGNPGHRRGARTPRSQLRSSTQLANPSIEPSPELHVDIRSDDHFVLAWRRGTTVISEELVPRAAVRNTEGQVRYPALTDAVSKMWSAMGLHRAPGDPERDRAVFHSGNTVPFDEIVAAMDAVRAVR
jgi:hypothetical protein